MNEPKTAKLSEDNLVTLDFRTIVKDWKNLEYWHRSEKDLLTALRVGHVKPTWLPFWGKQSDDGLALHSASHTLL